MPQTTQHIAESFQENGYYLAKSIFNSPEIRELEQDFDRIVAQLQSSGEEINGRWQGEAMARLKSEKMVVIHTHNVQNYSAKWLAALQHPRFLEVATAILGPDVILHHTKLFQKPGEKGAPFPMHQDWEYFPTIKDTMIAGVIHVSEATDEMGCFRIYPGSHRLGRCQGMKGGAGEESKLLREKYPIEEATTVEAEPGDVLFFHYFLLHGSMPNRSQKTRKTVLVQMHAGHDRVEPNVQHPNVRLTLHGWNHAANRSSAGCAD